MSGGPQVRPVGPTVDTETRAALPSRFRWTDFVVMPIFLGLVLLVLWQGVDHQEPDPIERVTPAWPNVRRRIIEHIQLTAVSTVLVLVLVLVIAIPPGIVPTRRRARRFAPFAPAPADIGQATPAIGLLVLLTLWLGVGVEVAIIGAVAYAVLPVPSSTIAGLKDVDRQPVEAARGIGTSMPGVLFRVELPLAVPLVPAGVRNAPVLNVGIATPATFVDAGGLGDVIQDGILLQRTLVLIVGSVPTVVLALTVDWPASLAETGLRPRGLRAGG
ncbi:ABC transporter permease subunit [Embleya sp. NBC_00888]|uniref:ABC transporter permease n=1 Tax=Embleya sp. NBC_00888 TaxID=2975960 RepID=UPI00386B03B4|nr:ABC transporter permease subunit [Embleya sp. NBC_00888]